ncbi:hypothetical protein TcWFU_005351 [Taenia crassiceps]|uniref:Uncharacterized protein n=1 Tax=Taenia crassiceps TaxID=6207 RepID=A0ABR4Q842_9CEST
MSLLSGHETEGWRYRYWICGYGMDEEVENSTNGNEHFNSITKAGAGVAVWVVDRIASSDAVYEGDDVTQRCSNELMKADEKMGAEWMGNGCKINMD